MGSDNSSEKNNSQTSNKTLKKSSDNSSEKNDSQTSIKRNNQTSEKSTSKEPSSTLEKSKEKPKKKSIAKKEETSSTLEKSKENLKKKFRRVEKEETSMDIFLCGKEIPEKFKSSIAGAIYIPKTLIKEVEFKSEQVNIKLKMLQHPVLDWRYYYFEEGELTENKIDQIYSVINTNWIEKERENNVLIVLVEDINSKEVSDVIKKLYEAFDDEGQRPKLIFTKKNDEDFNLNIKINDKEDENEDDEFDRKELNIFNYSETDKNLEIAACLFSLCSYFNQLGDSITFPFAPAKSITEEDDFSVKNFENTFNMLIVGDTGAGKSTLINKILGKRRARTGEGKPISKEIIFYFHDKAPLVLFDSPGYENTEDVKILIEKVNECNKDLKDSKNHIHAIVFAFNSQVLRIDEKKIEFLKKILKELQDTKVYIVLTKSGNEKDSKKYIKTCNSVIKQKLGVNHPLKGNVFAMELKNKKTSFGLNEFLQRLYADFIKEKIDEEKIEKLDSIDSMIKEVQNSKFFANIKSFQDLLDLSYYYSNTDTIRIGVFWFMQDFRTKEENFKKMLALVTQIGKYYGFVLNDQQSEEILRNLKSYQNYENPEDSNGGGIFIFGNESSFMCFGDISKGLPIRTIGYESIEYFQKDIQKDDASKKKFILSQVKDSNQTIESIKNIL